MIRTLKNNVFKMSLTHQFIQFQYFIIQNCSQRKTIKLLF